MAINDPKTLFKTQLTDVVASGAFDSEQVGTIRHGNDGKIYRWVQSTHGSAFVVGDVAFSSGEDDGADMNNFIEDGATDELMFMAGVCISAIPSGGFGWIQVDGVNAAVNHLGSASVTLVIGDSMIGVNGAVYVTRSTAVGTAPIYTKTIIAMESVATVASPSAATIIGLIKCFP